MQRDGNNKSIWQEEYLPDIKYEVFKKYDVLVVGAGITGMSTALKLQERGRSCVVVEANHIGFGTTSGTSAHLNTVLDTPYAEIIDKHGLEKAKLVVQSAREAIAIIQDNVDRYHIDCDFERSDGYMYAVDEKEERELLKIEDAIKQVGVHCVPAEKIPVPRAFSYAIKFAEQGHFHPTRYLGGLLEAFVSLGGKIQEQVVVQAVKEEGDNLLVETSSGTSFTVDEVVYATHTPPGIQLMNFRLAPYRSYLQVWKLSDDADNMKDVVYDMKDPFHYLRTVKSGQQRYLMVGGQDHKTAAQNNEKLNFLELEAYVRATYSVNEKIYQWSSQYYESQDSLPFIGQYPGFGNDHVYLATGFGGNGMIFGSLSAQIITDLIVNGDNKYQNLYSPSRFGPISSIGDFFRDNLDVAKHFILDRFRVEEIEGLVELSMNEGKVLKYQGEKIGVFKDQQGVLHAINPTCAHAACIVKWNSAEYSWDCPCHGARYSPDGKLLNGPTVRGLGCFKVRVGEDLDPK